MSVGFVLVLKLRSENQVKSGPLGLQIPLLSGINVIGLSQLPGALKTTQVTTHTYRHTIRNIGMMGQIRVQIRVRSKNIM